MPHKRVSDPHTEGRILLAINAFKQGQFISIRAAATTYDVPYTTTLRRAQGRPPRSECRPNGQKLSSTEESALENWIISLDTRGFPPRVSAVQDMANLLLAARTKSDLSAALPTVGENWARKFVNRHDTLKSRFSRKYDYQRAKNEDPEVIREWFKRVYSTIQEFGILEQDIYNFDETGFQMGVISTAKVVTRAERKGRPTLTQPGNREWVTAIETIRADRTIIPLMIIFAGKVHISTWYDEKQLPPDWIIGLSDTGWTNDELGMIWLRDVFNRHTHDRTIGRYRLLIIDGHGSHLTAEFHRFCEDNLIILLCEPAHSSHLLQPLDVGCFSVLKRVYGRMVEDWMRLGINHIDKQDFLTIYPKARTESQSTANIISSFRATGLVPYDPDQVLSRLNISFRTPTPPPSILQSPFTVATPYDISQLQQQANML
jgi:DDE superfamily endonuclease/Tc5 transposase DNA-binding domain/helix-turn-helix, Psq domain